MTASKGRKPQASSATRIPDKPITDAKLREMGNILRPFARDVSAVCRGFLGKFGDVDDVFRLAAQSDDLMELLQKTVVSLPAHTLAMAVAILATLPKSTRGRPLMPSTVEALKLAEEVGSNRKVSRLIADSTGEPSENIRARLRGLKRSTKRPTRRPKARGKQSR